MNENNGLIGGILLNFFPGAMRLFFYFPPVTYMILAIVSLIICLILLFLRQKFRKAWVYFIPVALISFGIWCSYHHKLPDQQIRVITDFDALPKDLVESADAGNVDAQIEVAMRLVKSHQADGGFQITPFSEIQKINHYATLAAENNSSAGYTLLGILKYFGLNGPQLKNQAIDCYVKAIELDRNNKDAYTNLLSIDSLEVTHPKLYEHYLMEFENMINEEDRHAQAVFDTLYTISHDKTRLANYLSAHNKVFHDYLPNNQDILYSLLNILASHENYDDIAEFSPYLTEPRAINSIRILPYIKTWQLNKYSKDIDSLLAICPSPVLNAILDIKEILKLDDYTDIIIQNEYANQLYIEGRCSKEERDSVIMANDKYMQKLLYQLQPIISRKLMHKGMPVDSCETIIFAAHAKYSYNSGEASYTFTPAIVKLP